MNAMRTVDIDWFWIRARGICRRNYCENEKSIEATAHALRFEAYQDAILPLVKIKVDLCAFKMLKYIRHSDGRIEIEWTTEERMLLATVDEMIAGEARRVGLVPYSAPKTG